MNQRDDGAPAKKTAKKTATKTAKKSATKTAKKSATKSAGTKRIAVKKTGADLEGVVNASAERKPRKPVTYKALPTQWLVKTGVQTVGLWVDEHVWTGNDNGECLKLERDTGALKSSWLLPGACVAVVSDDAWKYAGCANGCVYDLTGSVARVAYQLGGANHDWLEVNQGVLCVSDDKGTVSVIDVDGSIRWQKSDPMASEAWVLRTAADGLYHGSRVGLRKYDWSGKRVWQCDPGDVRYGHIEGESILVTAGCFRHAGSTSVALIDRETGATRWSHQAPKRSTGAEACAAGTSADGALRYYAATGEHVYCYDEGGALLWVAATGCDSLCNMFLQGETLYFVSANGTIGRADVSDAAFAKVASGAWETPITPRKQGRLKARSTAVERTTSVGAGVIVECVKEGSKLRVRVVSPGYKSDWFCQFPRDIREAGARYVVDEVREAAQGGFYRVLGDIKRLDE